MDNDSPSRDQSPASARLTEIEIDDAGAMPSSVIDQERRVAIFDLLEGNTFRLTDGPDGPYRLRLSMDRRRMTFEVTPVAQGSERRFAVSLGALEQAVKDYRTLCESYAEAVKHLPPARIEAVDGARRDMHAASAEVLRERLSGHAALDHQTARRLFTLICVLASEDRNAISP